jgi:Zn-dependent protease
MDEFFVLRLVIIALVILATAFHEMAHAFSAYYFGDPTPGRHGRLTFNPIPHLDPPLTAIICPALFYLIGGGLFCLAQTPISPARMRRPLRDHALTALAGPVTNFLFMGILIGILWIPGVWIPYGPPSYNMIILREAAWWNMVLGVFNLLPIPPLDGYRILRAFVPYGLRQQLDNFANMGMMSLMIVLIVGSFIMQYFLPYLDYAFFKLLPR